MDRDRAFAVAQFQLGRLNDLLIEIKQYEKLGLEQEVRRMTSKFRNTLATLDEAMSQAANSGPSQRNGDG